MDDLLREGRFWVQSGLGFALLAVVIAKSWRQRNGNGHAGEQMGVLTEKVSTLARDLHDLSELVAHYHSGHESTARERFERHLTETREVRRGVEALQRRLGAA